MSPVRILFLTPYPEGTAGSQRFRFEQYIPFLEEQEWIVDRQSFIDDETWRILYLPGHTFQKLTGTLKGFLRRLFMLLSVSRYHFVFIHREATPLGPPVIEWILAKVLHKKIIYDFDDAIWKENTTGANSLAARLKWANKVGSICQWSEKISVGNAFLAEYASQFNPSVVINPTTLDTENLHIPEARKEETSQLVVGWTGTHSTLKYLEIIIEVIHEVRQEMDFDFHIIADKTPEDAIKNSKFFKWNKKTEISDLNQIDIGLMPLEDDEWAKGKCGFKALQFMALAKPVLLTPVGVNQEIVAHGVSGYHCAFASEWKDHLRHLLMDAELRKEMGTHGRKKVISEFSVQSNKENFIGLFQ